MMGGKRWIYRCLSLYIYVIISIRERGDLVFAVAAVCFPRCKRSPLSTMRSKSITTTLIMEKKIVTAI